MSEIDHHTDTDGEVRPLAPLVAERRGRLADQYDPALVDAWSDAELAAERDLAEFRRAERRKRERERITAESAAESAREQARLDAEKKMRDAELAELEADIADLRIARKALAQQRRTTSPHARLASLYRHRTGLAWALVGVLIAGMLWSAANVQHNVAPGGAADPLFWFSYLLEAMISTCLIVLMIGTNKIAEWGVELERWQILSAEGSLLALTVVLNTYPYLKAGQWWEVAVHGTAPVMIGVALYTHNTLIAQKFGEALARATAAIPDDGPDPLQGLTRHRTAERIDTPLDAAPTAALAAAPAEHSTEQPETDRVSNRAVRPEPSTPRPPDGARLLGSEPTPSSLPSTSPNTPAPTEHSTEQSAEQPSTDRAAEHGPSTAGDVPSIPAPGTEQPPAPPEPEEVPADILARAVDAAYEILDQNLVGSGVWSEHLVYAIALGDMGESAQVIADLLTRAYPDAPATAPNPARVTTWLAAARQVRRPAAAAPTAEQHATERPAGAVLTERSGVLGEHSGEHPAPPVPSTPAPAEHPAPAPMLGSEPAPSTNRAVGNVPSTLPSTDARHTEHGPSGVPSTPERTEHPTEQLPVITEQPAEHTTASGYPREVWDRATEIHRRTNARNTTVDQVAEVLTRAAAGHSKSRISKQDKVASFESVDKWLKESAAMDREGVVVQLRK
ncbi:hypothetical protein [Nocardia wallacei]|uniref:hypothetical protein n=1 Tax=Nocardia wallacei TaxID=480035 RepID=UPI002454D6B3|nr:hypothetical protein [Nocardia wallacei]